METPLSRSLQLFLTGQNETTEVNLAGNKLKLFTAPANNSPQLKLADFVEATFVGYAADDIVGGDNVYGLDPLNRGVGKFGTVYQWTAGAVVGTEIVFGWYITDSTGASLRAYGFFDVPASVENDGDTITVVIFYTKYLTFNAEQEFLAGS